MRPEDGDGAGGRDHPDTAFAKKFLEMAEYGKEGRMYTYVIMLDGQWRFTVRIQLAESRPERA